MKLRNAVKISLLFAVLALSHCVMGNFTRTGNTYAPLAENAQVDVVMRSKPEYKYEVLGIAEVKGGSLEMQINKAREMARENGGDVIIIIESSTTYTANQYGVQATDVRSFEIAKRLP